MLPRPDARTAAAFAAIVFLGAWALLHLGFLATDQVVDIPVYETYGDAIADGKVPYRDFRLEYPPAALPAFAVPALVDRGNYRSAFEALMLVCGIAAVGFTAVSVRALRAPPAPPLLLVAVAPLALGSVILTRFDLWPAALVAAALAALLSGRDRLGHGMLGFAFAAKIYPAVLLPLALAWTWRRRGRRAALLALAAFAAVAAVCFVPFLILSPDGVWYAISRQASRPLQIESLGSGFLLAAHQVFGLGITMTSSHGSQNLVGTGPSVLAAVQSVLQAAALVALWIGFARGPARPERLVRFSAAAVVAFVALGKVLSPQFLIWLIPLVPLVRGRRLAWPLLLAALVLTQAWFPYRYWSLALHFDATASWLVLARDLVLVALLVALARPLSRAPE